MRTDYSKASEQFGKAESLIKEVMPENKYPAWQAFRSELLNLCASFRHYYNRLTKQNHRTSVHHMKALVAGSTARAASSHANLTCLPARRFRVGSCLPGILKALDFKLNTSEDYKPINVEDHLKDLGARARTNFVSELKQGLTVTIEYFRWTCGSRAGVDAHIIWRVPFAPSLRDSARTAELYNRCTLNQRSYLNRAASSLFISSLVESNLTSGRAAAHAIYQFIAESSGGAVMPCERTAAGQQALLAAHLILSSGDKDLAYDLRMFNGRVQDGAFDEFWNTLADMLEKYKRAPERRHGMMRPT